MSPQTNSFGRFFYWVITVAALGFLYSSGASAAIVLHGSDGGTVSGDGKFAHTGQCVDTATKQRSSTLCGSAPVVGYLYKGPDSAGKYYRTGTCWSRSLRTTVSCSNATGFISSSFSHHGITIEGGDLTLTLGDSDPSEHVMTVEPGAFGTPAKVNIDLPDVLVKGFDSNKNSLGQGRFMYHVEYEVPIATSNPNGGTKVDCSKCDPNIPNNKSCVGCSVNQTCTNLSTTESQFTLKAFCQQGVNVKEGYLTLLPVVNGKPQPAPKFTNCLPERVAAGECTLKVGGLPLKQSGTVDDTACAELFAPVDLAGDPNKHLDLKQLLLFQQNFQGQCSTPTLGDFGLESPEGAKLGLHRECNSDYGDANGTFVPADPSFVDGQGFDDTFRGCVVAKNADRSPAYHVVKAAETAKFIEVTVDVTPQSANLRCDAGTDSGIATATICTTSHFNANQVDTSTLPVLLVPGVCPDGPCTVQPISGGFSFVATTAGLCSGDFEQDLQITYRTCTADAKGLAQRILQANPDITDGTVVDVILQGTTGNGTVGIEGTDPVKVVKSQ